MAIGDRLKQARLEIGLSQTALCGNKITRNMLSLIENGAATPSVDTLLYLAQKLGKPVGYFLEDDVSVNQKCMLRARSLPPREALEALTEYQQPDPVFDPEYHLLTAQSALTLARQAMQEGKKAYCRELLQLAKTAGEQTPYYTKHMERERVLIAFLLEPERGYLLAKSLPSDEAPLLYAQAYLQKNDPDSCLAVLTGQSGKMTEFLRAEAYFAKKDYVSALNCYKNLPEDQQLLHKMELCCRELGDYEQAYRYACLQR